MTNKTKQNKTKRKLHSPKFKAIALKLAAKPGDAPAASKLGVYESQL
jgi:transposase-like protein